MLLYFQILVDIDPYCYFCLNFKTKLNVLNEFFLIYSGSVDVHTPYCFNPCLLYHVPISCVHFQFSPLIICIFSRKTETFFFGKYTTAVEERVTLETQRETQF